MTIVIWFKLILVNWDRFSLIKNKQFFQQVYAFREVLEFKLNCSNVIHSNVIHKFMFPLIFFYAKNFL